MSDLNIKVQNLDNGVVLIEASGFLDAHTFEQMERTINDLFDEESSKIIVKLEKLDYISSAGAGVFIGAIGQAQEMGGNLVLLNPAQNVREVFDLLGLTQIFPLATTAEEAVGYFSS